MGICTKEDDFLSEKTIWIATLSTGEKVYQDDDRQNAEPASAWLRLKNYCRQNNIFIVDLILRFRDHYENTVIPNAAGYFFCKRAAAAWGTPTLEFYVTGYLDKDTIYTKTWKIPELVLVEIDHRPATTGEEWLITGKADQ
jgi:hypothetical protein